MGGNPDDRDTRTFDREELEKLARESVDVPDTCDRAPVISRTATVADPLTMALLAEVARNARTQEFEPDDLPAREPEPLPHPNLKRR